MSMLDTDPWAHFPGYEEFPSDRYEQKLPTFYSSEDELDAFPNRGDLRSTQEAADLVFGAIFEGTAGKTSLPATMLDMFGGSLESLQSFIEDVPFLGDLAEIFTGNPDSDMNDIGSWVNNILGFLGLSKSQASTPGLDIGSAAGSFIDSILNPTGKLASSAAVQGAIDEAQAAASAVAAQGAQVQAVKAAILSFQDGIPLQPFSHSMTNSEMTYDRTRNVKTRVSDVTLVGSVSNDIGSWSSHTHRNTETLNTGPTTLDRHNHPDTFALTKTLITSMFTPAANTVVAGFLRAKWGGLRESFTFATGTVTSPCSLEVILGRMDPATGNIAILWVSADQTPIIGTGKAEYIVPIPDGVLLADRETVFVGIHQFGAGNVRPVVGIADLDVLPRDGLLYPAQPNTRFGRSTALTAGTTVAASSLLFDADYLPWLGVGQSLTIPVPAPTYLYESFDDGVMPASLIRRSGVPAKIEGGNFVVGGNDDGDRNYQYVKRLNRDDHFVESQIVDPNPSRGAFLGLRSDASGYNRIILSATSAGVSIERRGASTAVLASASMTVDPAWVLRFSAIDNVYSVHRIIDAETSTLLCQYVDSTNALPKGIDNRYITIGVRRNLFFNSGGWSYLLASDMPDPE